MATASGWVQLDEPLSEVFLRKLPAIFGRDLRSVMGTAGLQYRQMDRRVHIRASSGVDDFVYRKALQRSDGGFRTDARQTIVESAIEGPVDVSTLVGFNLSQARERGDLDVGSRSELQYGLFLAQDPLPVLESLAREGHRFFRISSRTRLYLRTTLLDVLEQLTEGVAPPNLNVGPGRTHSPLIEGNWQTTPAFLVCFPLLAHFQPGAMVVVTAQGAQVAVLPPPGMVHYRPHQLVSWPVGSGATPLRGPGRVMNDPEEKYWQHSDLVLVLEHCVAAANGLLAWLTDPAQWHRDDGSFDSSERWIAWTSVLQAFDALHSLATDWTGPSSVWDAFRALGILQGIWEGGNRGKVDLCELLRPCHLRDHAVPAIHDEALQEHQISAKFHGLDEEEALRHIQEIRNMVHGVGGPKAHRTTRLGALRFVSEREPSLQLIADLAVVWWIATMFSPSTLCRPGHPPWQG
jgi:hypothetical protein